MVVAVVSPGQFLIKPRIWSDVNLTAQNRPDPDLSCRLVKVNDAVHYAMVRNGHAVHAKLLDSFYTLFNFIGTVQKGIFRMDVKMGKCHVSLFSLPGFFLNFTKKEMPLPVGEAFLYSTSTIMIK